MKKVKKLIALLLLFCTVFTSIGWNPILVKAADNVREYEGDGYRIVCELVNAWQGGQQVQVTIFNTGSESIKNWGLRADFCGENWKYLECNGRI